MTVRDPGGSFGEAVTIPSQARLDVNDRGDVAAAWAEYDFEVRARYRPAGAARFSAPRTLAPGRAFPAVPFSDFAPQPGLAIDDSGRATASWELSDGATVSTVVRDFDAGRLAAPHTVDVVPSFVREAPPGACRPEKERVLRSSKAATVFRTLSGRVYGCLLRRGHPVPLGQFGGEVEPRRASTMALGGPFVAYGLDFGYGAPYSRFYLVDLRDEHSGFNRVVDLDGSGLTSVLAARVKPNGAVAWISRPRGGKVESVWAFDRTARSARFLDAGRRVDVRSFRLKGSRLSWRRADKLHHATLR